MRPLITPRIENLKVEAQIGGLTSTLEANAKEVVEAKEYSPNGLITKDPNPKYAGASGLVIILAGRPQIVDGLWEVIDNYLKDK